MTDLPEEIAKVRGQLAQRRWLDAHVAARRLTESFPRSAAAWCAASWAALGLNRTAEARSAAEHSLAISPTDPSAQLSRALCLQRAGMFKESAGVLRAIADCRFASGWEYGQLGEQLARRQQHAMSAAAYARAVAAAPDDADLHYSRATVLRYLGDLQGAEQSCAAALRLKPHDPDACHLRSTLRRQSREQNHIEELLDVRWSATHPRALSSIEYALAKEYEDIGDFDAAFAAMARAGKVRRANMAYDVRQEEVVVEEIISTYRPAMLSAARPAGRADGPVFIVGLPRTGTTLLERLLCNDPGIRSAGERAEIGMLITAMTRQPGMKPPASISEVVRSSAVIDFGELGRRYLERVSADCGLEGRFIDKFPLNYLYIGLIHLALPEARIVHMTRDPMDTCLAIYKQRFEDAHPYSHDLDDLGRFFIAYRRLMSHWHEVLPGRVQDVSYEELVRDPATICERVFAFCGLAWNASFVSAAAADYVATTASAAQVRGGIYTSSVGAWRNYEKHLGPLRNRLARANLY